MVLIPMLCCILCTIVNAAVGATCFVVGKKVAEKKGSILPEFEV